MTRPLPEPWTGGPLSGLGEARHGKVRDIYLLGDHVLLVATDRLSAFDCVLPDGIPCKGRVLTQAAAFWFHRLQEISEHHLITTDLDEMPETVRRHRQILEGRVMWVRRADALPVEFIVRGYLAGSGWAEYRRSQSICGLPLPAGLRQADRLPEPILTPTTKASEGHDENLDRQSYRRILGDELAALGERKALDLYRAAHEIAWSRGIILADTKLEFGLIDGRLVLIDEAFTPDSSRFWPRLDHVPGQNQVSFDKQFVRDHLLASGWDRRPPAPHLPAEVIERTARRYIEIHERLSGETIEA